MQYAFTHTISLSWNSSSGVSQSVDAWESPENSSVCVFADSAAAVVQNGRQKERSQASGIQKQCSQSSVEDRRGQERERTTTNDH